MEKEFIPYEQALALKELGFDSKKFLSFIFVDDENKFFTPSGWVPNNAIWTPTFSQAFRWFREKYGLEIALSPDSFNNISKNLRQYKIISYDKSWKLEEILEPSHWIRKGCFVSYEEAELECLKKLIEIVKNK